MSSLDLNLQDPTPSARFGSLENEAWKATERVLLNLEQENRQDEIDALASLTFWKQELIEAFMNMVVGLGHAHSPLLSTYVCTALAGHSSQGITTDAIVLPGHAGL